MDRTRCLPRTKGASYLQDLAGTDTDCMSETVQIIGAVATGVVAIIAAYGAVQTKKIHTIVNSRTDAMMARIDQLTEELHGRGDGSVPDTPKKED